MTTAILSRDNLARTVPSVFAAQPWERMSPRYKMLPTIEVIDILGGQGFFPVSAQQGKTRIPGKGDFTKHLLKFRRREYLDADEYAEVPELVLLNSHDGTSSYKFFSGIFRLCCLNGLISQSADYGSVKVRHSGGADFEKRVIDATFSIVEDQARVTGQIGDWKAIPLNPPQQLAFAEAATELRGNGTIEPKALLAPRRREDRPEADGSRDLWKTLNTAQEHLIKGGVQGVASTGRRMTTKPIKAIDADVKTNRALWILAERMAELVK